jgi:hypothetical protein
VPLTQLQRVPAGFACSTRTSITRWAMRKPNSACPSSTNHRHCASLPVQDDYQVGERVPSSKQHFAVRGPVAMGVLWPLLHRLDTAESRGDPRRFLSIMQSHGRASSRHFSTNGAKRDLDGHPHDRSGRTAQNHSGRYSPTSRQVRAAVGWFPSDGRDVCRQPSTMSSARSHATAAACAPQRDPREQQDRFPDHRQGKPRRGAAAVPPTGVRFVVKRLRLSPQRARKLAASRRAGQAASPFRRGPRARWSAPWQAGSASYLSVQPGYFAWQLAMTVRTRW